jgi:hypothetical protein
MIKISYLKHIEMMSISLEKQEVISIMNFIDRHILPSGKQLTDREIWYNLVYWYKKLPVGTKTKAYLYELMVVNEIVPDWCNNKGRHKLYCPGVAKCPIVSRKLAELERDWIPSDKDNICGNLAICFRLAEPAWHIFDYGDDGDDKEIPKFEIDDTVLKEIKRWGKK